MAIIQKYISRHSNYGLTLVELLISISIIAAITSYAVPNFQKYIIKSHFLTSQTLFRSSLSLARQTSITTKYDTYICELKNNSCNPNRPFNADWSNGWIVFIDFNNNQTLDFGDEIIQIQQQRKGVAIVFNQRGRLRFRPNGSARSAGFYLCNENEARHILILYTGRTRTKILTDKKNIDKCKKAFTQNLVVKTK